MSPVRAPLRSSRALVAVVVPCTITLSSAAAVEASPRAATTPAAWLATVVITLATRTSPEASSTRTRSVKVPPTSTPTSIVSAMCPPRGCVACCSVSPEPRGRGSPVSRRRVASKLWLPDGRAESQKYGYPQGGHRDADERAGVLQQTARALSEPSPERAQSPGDGDRGGDGLSSQGRAAVFARRAPAPRGPAPGRATPAVRKRRRPGSPGAVGSRRPDRGQAAPAIPAGPARPPRGLWRADGRPDHRAPPPRDQHGDPGTGLGTRAPCGAAQRAEYHAARQLAQAADPPADLRRLERGPARLSRGRSRGPLRRRRERLLLAHPVRRRYRHRLGRAPAGLGQGP